MGDEPKSSQNPALAEIRPVSPEFTGKVLTQGKKLFLYFYMLLTVAVCAFLALLALCYFVVPFQDSTMPLWDICIYFASSIFLGGLSLIQLSQAAGPANDHLLVVVKKRFGKRPDHWVESDDPCAEFVEIVPPENRERVMLETATDIGFLVIDEATKDIRFEGDKERYRIPAVAIQFCQMKQSQVDPYGWFGGTHFHVVLSCETASGPELITFTKRWRSTILGKKRREQWTRETVEQIERLMKDAKPKISL